jgi:CRISPR type III-B/RAMP module RAMP protein Cmr1
MNSQIISRSFRFLTPAFPHGAYQSQTNNIPEFRAASVRGQLRWWWRTLGYGLGDELFGSASGDHGSASKVQVRLICPKEIQTSDSQILPHKENSNHRGNKRAIQENINLFTVELRPVRGGLMHAHIEQLKNTVDAWLLMGAVGQRANRAAGSVWPESDAPDSPSGYLNRCRSHLAKSSTRIALLDIPPMTAQQIRNLSGRFLGGFNVLVPGNVFGSAVPRKSSSLKLRAVRFNGDLAIAALWCPKEANDTPTNLRAALARMKDVPAKSELASLLEASLPDLCP